MKSKPRICDVCNKPMIEDGHTAFYAGLRHWDCQFPDGYKSTEEVFSDIRDSIGKLEDKLHTLINGSKRK